jgi:uncharacterized protein (TIGR03437 family)
MMSFIERRPFTRILTLAGLTVSGLAGQSYQFDNSSNKTLTGQYFVREVAFRNLSAQGGIGEALSVVGIATFDGAGNYAFSGQLADSTSKTGARSAAFSGAYAVGANGFLRIASFALTGAFPSSAVTFAFGGVGAAGPAAFTASTTEGSSPAFDLMVGIPIGPSVSNASLKGAFNAVYLIFPQAAVGQARQAYMPLQADGAGGCGAVTATGSATDNANLTTQTIPGVTYALSGTTGTINFGAAASNQLISGTQSFFVSPDGSLLVGGSAGGFDLLLASPPVSSPSNASFRGFYFLGGLDADNSVWTSQGASLPEAFYGSVNATGQGLYTSHLRLNANGYPVEDLTSGWSSNVQANGSFAPGDGDQYWLGAKGQVVLALGAGNFYSIVAGLHAIDYASASSAEVFLNPLGIVNAASFAPPTNPVAPKEMVTVFGSNLSSGTAQASSFPLPTTLANSRVLVNGVAAPLLSVSPTQITLLVPNAANPDLTAYAVFEVQNNPVVCPTGSQCPMSSKLVYMYTNYTAPGVFSLAQNGFGAAAAEVNPNGRYSVVGASNPVAPGDIPMLFVTGLGSVTPSLLDGIPSSPTGQPLNVADIYNRSDLYVYFDGFPSPNIAYAGVVPGYAAGLYQINAQVPSGISTGADYLDILTPDAEAEQVTLNIDAAGKAATAARAKAQRRPAGRGQRAARRGSAIAPQGAPAAR